MQILAGEISSSKLQKILKIYFPYVEVPTCLQTVNASITSEFVSEKRKLTVYIYKMEAIKQTYTEFLC